MSEIADFRSVARFDDPDFVAMPMPGTGEQDVTWKNVSYDEATGQGSYLMKMGPGTKSNPHIHHGPEEFYVLEGNIVDHDGFEYRAGEFVSLAGGSRHWSHSPLGCLLVVTHRGVVEDVAEAAI